MRIGRWSEWSACRVIQDTCRLSEAVMVVISGEVGCWSVFGGFRVGVSVLSVMWLEFCIMFDMSVPL